MVAADPGPRPCRRDALFRPGIPGISSLPWIGVAALLLAGGLFAVKGAPDGMSAFIPLGALALWCALSIAWSIEPDASWSYANRTFIYLTLRSSAQCLPKRSPGGFSSAARSCSAPSVSGRCSARRSRGCTRTTAGSRSSPRADRLLERARAPRRHRAADRALPSRRAWRTAGTLLVFGWIVVIGMTYSRGGVLVAVVVVVLWTVLTGAWLDSVSTVVAAGLPAARGRAGGRLLAPGADRRRAVPFLSCPCRGSSSASCSCSTR